VASRKAPRAKFALPGGTKASGGKPAFPMNTPGRVAAAPGLAGRSQAAGNISAAQAAKVKAAAKRARGTSKSKK